VGAFDELDSSGLGSGSGLLNCMFLHSSLLESEGCTQTEFSGSKTVPGEQSNLNLVYFALAPKLTHL